MKKSQALVDIFNLVDSHLARVWFTQSFSRYDFQKPHKIFSIRQVGKEIADLETIKYKIFDFVDCYVAFFKEKLAGLRIKISIQL